MIGSLRGVEPSPAFPLLPAATRSDGLEVSSTSEAVSVGWTPAAHCVISPGADARSDLSCLLASEGELMLDDAMLDV